MVIIIYFLFSIYLQKFNYFNPTCSPDFFMFSLLLSYFLLPEVCFCMWCIFSLLGNIMKSAEPASLHLAMYIFFFSFPCSCTLGNESISGSLWKRTCTFFFFSSRCPVIQSQCKIFLCCITIAFGIIKWFWYSSIIEKLIRTIYQLDKKLSRV